MKSVKVVLSPEAEKAYKQLNIIATNSKLEKSILNSINKKNRTYQNESTLWQSDSKKPNTKRVSTKIKYYKFIPRRVVKFLENVIHTYG